MTEHPVNAGGADEFKKKLEEACQISRVEYLRRRQDLATDLGLPVTMLDQERKRVEKEQKGEEGSPQFLADPVLWDEPVDGSKLLNELTLAARAHLGLPKGAGRGAGALDSVQSRARQLQYLARACRNQPSPGMRQDDFADVLIWNDCASAVGI